MRICGARLASGVLAVALGLPCGIAASFAGEPPKAADDLSEAGKGRWIVSPRSYWRHHFTFRPAQSYNPKDGKLSFMDTRYAAGLCPRSFNHLATAAPPKDWMQPDFDDSDWCVNRAPMNWLPEMDQSYVGPYACHVIRKVCGRTRFVVPDPSRINKLNLELRYYGGVIAYVNGQEVGRGDVAKDGVLAAEGFAEPYPEEAYRPATPEQMQRAKDAKIGWGNMLDSGWWNNANVYQRWLAKPGPGGAIAAELCDRVMEVRVRRLALDIPRDVLRPGVNVLAVECRLSPVRDLEVEGKMRVAGGWGFNPHIGVTDASVQADPADAVVSADARPGDVQVWAEDIHRWLMAEDFLEPGVKPSRVIRMAAPRNGACSGQAVIGAGRELAKASAAVSDLSGPGGAKLPPSAVQVRWGRSRATKAIRGEKGLYGGFSSAMLDRDMIRYLGAPQNWWVIQSCGTPEQRKALDGVLKSKLDVQLFDHLGAAPPAKVAAGASQPVWITVEVPRDAVPGAYSGTLALRAEGMEETKLQLELQVFDFALPDPRDWTTYVGIDESPWALAAWHKVKPWSEEHWKLLEQSVQHAGKLGARVAGIPVVHHTELDNNADVMIKWVRRADGAYDFDFTLADRYLALWRKYGHSQPDIIVYLVLPADVNGRGGGTGTVTVVDPASRQEAAFTPPKPDTPEGEKLWVACAKAIRTHFNERGIQDGNLHWGLYYDFIGDATLAAGELLAREVSGIGWARASHDNYKPRKGSLMKVTWQAAVRGANDEPPFAKDGKVESLKGWRNPAAALLLPRSDSDVSAMSMLPPLWQLREAPEMPLTAGYRGFARISVDGWCRGGKFGPFNPYLTYPAEGGGGQEASVQFEVLREGLQEAETRIFLEKQETLPPDIQKVLAQRTERVWMIAPRVEGQRIGEYYAGWREMSWDLYASATVVSGGRALSADARARFVAVPTGKP